MHVFSQGDRIENDTTTLKERLQEVQTQVNSRSRSIKTKVKQALVPPRQASILVKALNN